MELECMKKTFIYVEYGLECYEKFITNLPVAMTFTKKLTQISKLLFFFGISPYFFNQKSNKFECSIVTIIYTCAYSLSISFAIIYILFTYYLEEEVARLLSTTFKTIGLLQQSTIIIISCLTLFDLIVKRKMHAGFLNDLIELDTNLAKLKMKSNRRSSDLSSLRVQQIAIIFVYAIIYFINSIMYLNFVKWFEHVWNALQFFQTISLTLVGYYIRCLATILYHRCEPILHHLDLVRTQFSYNNYSQGLIAELIKDFKLFDEIMNLKNQLSNIFGLQLLLNTTLNFVILTISVYGILYYHTQSGILYFFVTSYLCHTINCVLLVTTLDTLSDQV